MGGASLSWASETRSAEQALRTLQSGHAAQEASSSTRCCEEPPTLRFHGDPLEITPRRRLCSSLRGQSPEDEREGPAQDAAEI